MSLPAGVTKIGNIRGPQGPAGTVAGVTVVMIPAGEEPSATMRQVGDATFVDFLIPRGLPGINAIPAANAVAAYATATDSPLNTALRSFLLPRTELDAAAADRVTTTGSALRAALTALLLPRSEVASVVAGLINATGVVRSAIFDAFGRFSKPIQHPVAVTIGSSNAEPSRGYVQTLCDRNGLINKNFAVGGGGFNQPGALAFSAQIDAALADTSYAKGDVTHVFIIDTGNDSRGKTTLGSGPATEYARLTAAYPNAIVYVVPSILTLAAPNTTDREILRWVSRHFNELRNAAQSFDRVQVIPYSHLWFWDGGSWMNTADGFNVHLNTAGYNRLVWYLEQYINRRMVQPNDLPDSTGAIDAAVTGEVHSRRTNGVAFSYGNFTLAADRSTSLAVAQVAKGFEPLDRLPVAVVKASDGTTRQFELAADGKLNLQVATPAGTYYWSATYEVM